MMYDRAVTWREVKRLLLHEGFKPVKERGKTRGKGGHVLFEKNGVRTILPTGSGELKPGTMKSILEAIQEARDQERGDQHGQ
jgi:predicted RNA binding protein YcfA (HicA-like mRNA interferase family)